MYNTFLLSYDPLASDPTPARLIEFIRSNAYTYQYLTPFLGTVFVKSQASLVQMMGSYDPFISPNAFTLIEVSPILMSGLLPQAYWNWLNAAAPPPLAALPNA
jgi:hypothetical protein